VTHYAKRDAIDLEPHYSKHVGAMTREALHSKADIAAELAWRDARIADLETKLRVCSEQFDAVAGMNDENVRLAGMVAELRGSLLKATSIVTSFDSMGSYIDERLEWGERLRETAPKETP